ncbi:DNA-binding response regulator, partial [Paenibacillus sp. 28ISP30-2]|nr:DNA-binding response regulator [Paenibacillus sp. 28ISP30-2]
MNPLILLVNGNEASATTYVHQLKQEGYQVVYARNVAEGESYLDENSVN